MKHRSTNIFALIAAGLFVFQTSVASAGSTVFKEAETVNLSFAFDATDLDSRKGAKKILRRLHGAAKKNCAWTISPTVRRSKFDRECSVKMVHRAVAAIDHPTLDDLYGQSKSYRIATQKLGLDQITIASGSN